MLTSLISSWRKIFLGGHLVFSALPLLFLAAGLLSMAKESFHRTPALYPRPFFEPEETADYLIDSWKTRGHALNERIIAIWGLADKPGGEVYSHSPAIRLALAMAKKGVQIRVSDPAVLDKSRTILGNSVTYFADPMAALKGAHGVLLATEWPSYVNADFSEIAKNMAGKEVLDCRAAWPGQAIDAAGLFHLVYAKPSFPPWLDPELLLYVKHLQAMVGEEEGILMIPDGPLGTLSGRARWFLHLNYLLFPRRLYLRKPSLACGTSGQYREWVLNWNKDKPWRGTRRTRFGPRTMSGVAEAAPTRSLTSTEIQAIQEWDADWVLFWSHNSDFRITDWECVSTEAIP